jgi:hypothetical protein
MQPPCSTEAGSYSVKSATKHGQLSKGRGGDWRFCIVDWRLKKGIRRRAQGARLRKKRENFCQLSVVRCPL